MTEQTQRSPLLNHVADVMRLDRCPSFGTRILFFLWTFAVARRPRCRIHSEVKGPDEIAVQFVSSNGFISISVCPDLSVLH